MRFPVALAFALAFALPSVADAQPVPVPGGVTVNLTASLEDPGHPMAPGKNETLDLFILYQPGPGAVPAPGPNPDPTNGDPNSPNNTARTKIHFAMKKTPSWVVNATFVPAVAELPVEPGQGGQQTARIQLVLKIDPAAPGLQKEEIVVTAIADPNGNVPGKSQDSPPINLKPAFVPRANVTGVQDSIIVPGGRWTDVPFLVKNLGNMEGKMRLNVTARPQDSQVEFPQTVTIPRNGSQTVTVRLRIPWTYGEGGTLELEALPLSDDDTGKPTKGDVEIMGQSAVPGASVAIALGAVAAVAIATRRR